LLKGVPEVAMVPSAWSHVERRLLTALARP
jgi:hypothetical protein